MKTITLPKTKYDMLEKKATLYSTLLEREEEVFPIEIYSPARIKGFLKEDKVSPSVVGRVNKFLGRSG